ncbi:MAG: hypothetical protein NTY50_05555 [Methylobacter sp.]|nr:hypothetical protein [Methylobacter sp.]
MTRFVISSRKDALGSRLINVMHGWRLAKALDVDYFVAWPRFWEYYDADAPLSDFFDFSSVNGFFIEESKSKIEELMSYPGIFEVSKWNKDSVLIPLNAPAYRFRSTLSYPLQGEVVEDVNRETRQLMCSVKLNAEVEEAMSKVRACVSLKNYAAIHIRRGDFVANLALYNSEQQRKYGLEFCQKFVDVPSYANAINALCPDSPLFIFSKDMVQVKQLAATVNVPVANVGDICHLYSNLSPVQQDFIEMLIMAECKMIIGARRSNFSRLPAALGGIQDIEVHRWILPQHTIVAVEEALPDNHRMLALIFEGYARLFQKNHKDKSAIFTERSIFHAEQAKKDCDNIPGVYLGLDVYNGLNRLKGNGLIYRRALSEFDKNYESATSHIQQLLVNDDYSSAEKFLVNLGQIAGELGAIELQTNTNDIIDTIHSRIIDDQVIMKFNEALVQVMVTIRLILNSSENPIN